MAAKHVKWTLRDIYLADNPNPMAQPARVTYVSYHSGTTGLRIVRLDTNSPSQTDVVNAITGDIKFFLSYQGVKGQYDSTTDAEAAAITEPQ